MRKIAGLALMLVLLLGAALALGETARVATPGGKLNVRKTPDEKGKLAMSVPNHALVEAEPAEEAGWVRVTYKGKTGYAREEYFLLPSRLPGKTVYSDKGTVKLLNEPGLGAVCVWTVSNQEPMEVLEVRDGWASVRCGEHMGWAPVENFFTWQREAPAGEPEWIELRGRTVAETPFIGASGPKSLAAGTPVRVTFFSGSGAKAWAWIETEGEWGVAPQFALSLLPPEEAEEDWTGRTRQQALMAAEEALRRKVKAFAKKETYGVVGAAESVSGIPGPLYLCAFCDENDQMLFLAVVRAADGKVLFTEDYSDFAAPKTIKEFLPKGEVRLTLSAEELAVGEILDARAEAWCAGTFAWSLARDGQTESRSEPGEHDAAAFRPREPGSYTLTVTVRDPDGLSESASAAFTVTEPALAEDAAIYSQKDGWWLDKPYRMSTLDQSGCAIFTLSHALHRMGYTGQETLPEHLAVKYRLCLTPDGTNNERLINESGAAFGFKTERDLIEDQKRIAKLLKDGALFSFSIVRGHIALIDGISEDGSMVHIVDSAPSATMERKVNVALYRQTRSGGFRAVLSLSEFEGARWYFETDHYGGLSYWMPLSYAAKRGVRLIQPPRAAAE